MTAATSFNVAGVSGAIQSLDTTGGVVYDSYLADIAIVKAAAAQTTALTDVQATNLKNALDDLKDMFANGKMDPATGRVTYFTQDIANSLSSLFISLQFAGIDPTGATIQYPSVGGVPQVTNALNAWRTAVLNNPVSLNNLLNFAATVKNRSTQALVELDYVGTGNDVMATQMTSLQGALNTTQSVLSTLGELQSIHNQVDVVSKASFTSVTGFDMTGASQSSDDAFIAAYNKAASSFFGVPITPTSAFSAPGTGYELATIPTGDTVVPSINSLQPWIDQFGAEILNGPNSIRGDFLSEFGEEPNFNAGDLWHFNPSGTLNVINPSTGATSTVAVDMKFDGAGQNYFGLPNVPGGASSIRFFPVVNYDDSNPFIAKYLNTSSSPVPGTLGKAVIRLPGRTEEYKIYYVIPNTQNNFSQVGTDPAAEQAFYNLRVEMTTLSAMYNLNSQKFSLSPSFSGYYNGAVNNLIYAPYDPELDGANTQAIPIRPWQELMILHGYSPTQEIDIPPNFGSNSVWLKFDPSKQNPDPNFTVDTTHDPAIALNIRNTLVKAMADLNTSIATLQAQGASADSSLLTSLIQVRSDLTSTLQVNGNLITANTSLQDCVAPVQAWLIDRYNLRNTPDGAKAGLYQQNITNAVTAGQSVNTSQQDKVRNFLYIFQEYYKSASAVLQQLTQIIQRMGQGISR